MPPSTLLTFRKPARSSMLTAMLERWPTEHVTAIGLSVGSEPVFSGRSAKKIRVAPTAPSSFHSLGSRTSKRATSPLSSFPLSSSADIVATMRSGFPASCHCASCRRGGSPHKLSKPSLSQPRRRHSHVFWTLVAQTRGTGWGPRASRGKRWLPPSHMD